MERKPDRKFGWLQFDATEEMVRAAESIQALVDPADVIELEDEPHVTVLYGLGDVEPQLIRDQIAGLWPGPWSLAGLSVFRNKKSHVLKVGVSGDKLFALNAHLQRRVPHKGSFSGYQPHLTIGHLRPGTADKYISSWKLDQTLLGLQAPGDVLVFHSKDRQRYELPL